MINKEQMYEYGLTKTMEYLMPWIDKTDQNEVMADWEMNVPELNYALLLNRFTGYLPEPKKLLVQHQLHLLADLIKEDSNIKLIEHEQKMQEIFRVEKSGELFSVGSKSTPKRLLVLQGLGGKRPPRYAVSVFGPLAQIELVPGDVIAGKLQFDTFEYDGRTLQDITLIDFVNNHRLRPHMECAYGRPDIALLGT